MKEKINIYLSRIIISVSIKVCRFMLSEKDYISNECIFAKKKDIASQDGVVNSKRILLHKVD